MLPDVYTNLISKGETLVGEWFKKIKQWQN